MKNTFLIFIIVFVSGGLSKTAANELFIADTTLSRLYPAIIRLQGSLDNPADSVRIVLKYNANQLNIIDVFSDENNIFMEPVLDFYNWGTALDDQVLVITSKKINPNGKYFCNIKLQALISKDTIYRLEPSDLTINGSKADALFTGGNFLVKNPVAVTNKSEIGYAYPNPFGYETKIEFTLSEDDEVSINIYDSFGRFVRSVEKNYDPVEFIFLNSENKIIRFNPGEKLPKGRYYINWQPAAKLWGSGAYFIVFNIGGEIYQTNVLLAR